MAAQLPLRVMVVDDSPIARRALSEALRQIPGVELVASAPNGRIALTKIAASPPDVCVLDLEMPEMDGLALLEHLGKDFPATRVVVYTARSDAGAVRAVHALSHGATDVVAKPMGQRGYEDEVAALRDRLVPKLLKLRKSFQAKVKA